MSKEKNKKSETVPRKLYFYDLSLYHYSELQKDNILINEQDQYVRTIFKKIFDIQEEVMHEDKTKLKEELQKKLQFSTEKGDTIYVIVDSILDDEPIQFKIVLCRNNAFPFVQMNGKLEFMTSYLKGEFALAEVTHCVLFTDTMVMGAEFNFSGARPSAVADYLKAMDSYVTLATCRGKINKDAFGKIAENKTLSLFELSIKNDSQMKTKLIANQGFIGAWLRGAPDDVDEYEMILKRRKTKKKDGFASPISKEQMKDFVVNNREEIGKFKISQGAYKDHIDLLNDKLVQTSDIPIETNNKTIKSENVYKAIRLFYNNTVVLYCKK